jgi:apolipoprotein N-acyltransferase
VAVVAVVVVVGAATAAAPPGGSTTVVMGAVAVALAGAGAGAVALASAPPEGPLTVGTLQPKMRRRLRAHENRCAPKVQRVSGWLRMFWGMRVLILWRSSRGST